MNGNSIRVRILAADAAIIHIVPVDDIRECRRCAEGNGCGNRPWFRGFFRHGSIVLPNRDGWRAGETAAEDDDFLHVYPCAVGKTGADYTPAMARLSPRLRARGGVPGANGGG